MLSPQADQNDPNSTRLRWKKAPSFCLEQGHQLQTTCVICCRSNCAKHFAVTTVTFVPILTGFCYFAAQS